MKEQLSDKKTAEKPSAKTEGPLSEKDEVKQAEERTMEAQQSVVSARKKTTHSDDHPEE